MFRAPYYCPDCNNLSITFKNPTYCSKYCKKRFHKLQRRGVFKLKFKQKEDDSDIYDINAMYDRYINNYYYFLGDMFFLMDYATIF
jgi:hypothetical protein